MAASRFYDLAIGFAIVAGGYGAGAISGGCFNPAVALGLDISSAFQGIRWDPVYCGCEVGGACLAAGLFRVDRPDDFGGSPDYGLSTKCVSEFIGAYALVFTIGLNVLGGVPAGAWSIAASLIGIVYALGSCSGAPFNLAVTVAIRLSGRDRCSPGEGAASIGSQLVGGVAAEHSGP